MEMTQPSRNSQRWRTTLLTIAVCVWLAVCLSATALVWRYKNAPGGVGVLQPTWPAGTALTRPASGPVLLMFAHPMCPCTEASLAELRVLMARVEGRLAALVVLIHPPEPDADWAPDDFRREAESIPGVRVIDDFSNEEAARFGAQTSGHTLLYDAEGRLLFSGGITLARGHQGDNSGVDHIVAVMEHRTNQFSFSPIFGCALRDPGAQ